MIDADAAPAHPRLLILASALLFSTAAPVTKFVSMPTMSIAFFRSLVGVAALVVLVPRSIRRRLTSVRWGDALTGALYASTSLCLFWALRNTSAANATILFQTSPIFLIPLGHLLLGERADLWDLAAIVLMTGGIVLCFRGGISTDGRLGDLIALGGSLSFALLNIRLRRGDFAGRIRGILAGNLIIILAAAPSLAGRTIPVRDAALAGTLGLVHMALPFLLYSRALHSVRALEAAIYKNLETVAAPVWVALLVGEIPTVWTILGFVCVLCALVLRARTHSNTPTSPT